MVLEATSEFDLIRATASDPLTAPGELSRLSGHSNRSVRRLVACNPNTPEEDLLKLWNSYGDCVLKNSIIDIWAITESRPLCEKLPNNVLVSLYFELCRGGQLEKMEALIPESFRIKFPINLRTLGFWMAQDPSPNVRKAVANRTHQRELQVSLATDPNAGVRLALAGNYNLCEYCHRVMASDPEMKVQMALAENDNVKGEAEEMGFDILSISDFEVVRAEAAKNRLVTSKIIEHSLIHDESPFVQEWLAGNPALGKELHRRMQDTDDVGVLAELGKNKCADPEFLKRLAESKNSMLRAAAAANPKTPPADQVRLFGDFDLTVRNAFVGLAYCSRGFFEYACTHGGRELKCRLAKSAGQNREQLRTLARDPDPKVRSALAERLRDGCFQHDTDTNRELVDLVSRDECPKNRIAMVWDRRLSANRINEMALDPNAEVRSNVARHYHTSHEMMKRLITDPVVSVRFEATLSTLGDGWSWGTHNNILFIDNPSMKTRLRNTIELLLSVVRDSKKHIRLLLAGHRCTPAAILNELLEDEDSKVRETLAKRNSFPRDAMIPMRGDCFTAFSRTINARMLTRLSRSSNTYVRGLVARNSRTTAKVLRKLSRDRSDFVRQKLLENPKNQRAIEKELEVPAE